MSARSREKPRVCEILVKKVERKDIGKWKYHLTFLSFPVLQYDKSMHIAVTHNDTETQNNIIIHKFIKENNIIQAKIMKTNLHRISIF